MTGDTPTFAVVGRVNKGKSTLVSTLTEDDSVRVSATPGETMRCQRFPINIDGREIMSFVDTPGFQNSRRALVRIKTLHEQGLSETQAVAAFVREIHDDPDFADEYELLSPIIAGAGIIYVVDGSDPYREDYKAEMEILRWTGQPRMAIVNHINEAHDHRDDWKAGCNLYFNLVRAFNAAQASPADRFALLDDLLKITPDWHDPIRFAIDALRDEWTRRIDEAADVIARLLMDAVTHTQVDGVNDPNEIKAASKALREAYHDRLRKIERQSHDRLQSLYRHFRVQDESDALSLEDDLFSETSWEVFGLSRQELAWAAAAAGATAGAAFDVAATGITFGVGTAIGAVGGASAAWLGAKRLAEVRIDNEWMRLMIGRKKLGRTRLIVGPHRSEQFPWILLDRALSRFRRIVLQAHGRRSPQEAQAESSIVSGWEPKRRAGFEALFRDLRRKHRLDIEQRDKLEDQLRIILKEIVRL